MLLARDEREFELWRAVLTDKLPLSRTAIGPNAPVEPVSIALKGYGYGPDTPTSRKASTSPGDDGNRHGNLVEGGEGKGGAVSVAEDEGEGEEEEDEMENGFISNAIPFQSVGVNSEEDSSPAVVESSSPEKDSVIVDGDGGRVNRNSGSFGSNGRRKSHSQPKDKDGLARDGNDNSNEAGSTQNEKDIQSPEEAGKVPEIESKKKAKNVAANIMPFAIKLPPPAPGDNLWIRKHHEDETKHHVYASKTRGASLGTPGVVDTSTGSTTVGSPAESVAVPEPFPTSPSVDSEMSESARSTNAAVTRVRGPVQIIPTSKGKDESAPLALKESEHIKSCKLHFYCVF